MRHRSLTLASVALLSLVLGASATSADELPGVDATIAVTAAAPTRLAVRLTAGELLHLVLTPTGIDLAVRATGPDGGELWAADDAPSATLAEKVWLIAPTSGTYTVELSAKTGAAGTVRVSELERRPATATDRERVRAELQLQAGRRALRSRARTELTDARAALEGAAATLERLGAPRRLVTAKLLSAMVERVLGDPSASRERAREAHRTAAAADYPVGEGAALNSLAIGWWASGDMEQARRSAHDAAEAYGRAGYTLGEAESLNTVGLTAERLGDLDAAEAAYERAADLFSEIANTGGVLYARNNLAAVQLERAEYDAAIDTFEEVAGAFAERGDRAAQATALMNIGAVLNDVGDLDRARRHLERALELQQSLGAPAQEAAVLANLGSNSMLAGALDDAREAYEHALELYRRAGDRAGESTALNSLGDLALRQGRPAAARPILEQALAIRRELGLHRDLASTLANLGAADLATGRLETAAAELQHAASLAAQLEDPEGEAVARDGLARLALARDDLDTAEREAARAIALIESLRARLASDTLRATYLGLQRGLYELAVKLALIRARQEPGGESLERAFALSERAHARSLVELLAPDRPAIANALDPDLAARIARLEAEVARLQRRLIGLRQEKAPDATAVATTQEQLLAAVDEWRAARNEALRCGSPLASLLDPQLVDAHEAAADLGPHATLLEYLVGEETSTLLVVDSRGVAAYPLPAASELASQVSALRDTLARPRARVSGAYLRAARELFELLVAPAAARLADSEELVIVPDGPLHLLPFEVLLTTTPATTDPRRLPYLIRRWRVRYALSASALAELERRNPGPRPWDLVAVADPEDEAIPPTADRALLLEAGRWRQGGLPEARREAAGIAGLFPSGRSCVLEGAAATESAVKSSQAVASARYLHFAVHGVLSSRLATHSSLVLARAPGSDEDGLLQAWEVYELHLGADLVVLSSCGSGLGKAVRGEGLVGLTQAFLTAGAQSVLASLWNVPDRASADLMIDFYRRLTGAGGEHAAEALRQAKLTLIESPVTAHPAAWGAFVLHGAAP